MQGASVNGSANYEHFQETKEDEEKRENPQLRSLEYSLKFHNFSSYFVFPRIMQWQFGWA